MRCIIIDDEPLAREAVEMLINKTNNLFLIGSFNSPETAKNFIENNIVELIFLDIKMAGINGIEFARTIQKETFVVFTTAYPEFATDSYEVDAIDYLIKPIKLQRFQKAVEKAYTYSKLFIADYANNNIEQVTDDFFFVKAERRIFKVYFKDILFIQGLKDYVVMHTENQKVITAMNIKTMHEQLPRDFFVRVSKSYIINAKHIDSVDNNTVYIGTNEIPIGNIYRDFFFDEFVTKKILSR
ncbi:transcriptional regulator [Flavobacterium akiainvivens]|uniref:Transcriptional regulator n=1 Tax=Flavobacterium akiainvivens TaxID=1202724 RepID=A0A0M9VHH1_9FLAO|nr:LytTR family DNA-binding domain-containing protein [Flavobacterium akiainvivens]KOS05309.1 transcriptional regulator [Flavobacterium akiainvivens]SFQ76345.1 two component transcriptional regulator, LytTR family [Flavobacterium akiainvivens]